MSVPNFSPAPGQGAFAIVASDTTDLARPVRGIYVGVTGDITLNTHDGDAAVLFKAVPAGIILPVCAKRVKATGTTATNLVGIT